MVHMSDGSVKAVADMQRGDKVLCNTHLHPNDIQHQKQKYPQQKQKHSHLYTDMTVESSGNHYHYAEVQCVVQTKTQAGLMDLMHFPGGLQVTPYHPIFSRAVSPPSSQTHDSGTETETETEGGWQFPVDMVTHGEMHTTKCDAVYSFLLGPAMPMTSGKELEGCGANTENSNGNVQENGNGRAESMLINGISCITLAHGITYDVVAAHEFYGSERVVQSLREVGGEQAWREGKVVLEEGCVLKDQTTGRACGFMMPRQRIGVDVQAGIGGEQ